MKPLPLPTIQLELPDKLPQPFRMIDKTVTHIVERSLQKIDELELHREQAKRQQINQVQHC